MARSTSAVLLAVIGLATARLVTLVFDPVFSFFACAVPLAVSLGLRAQNPAGVAWGAWLMVGLGGLVGGALQVGLVPPGAMLAYYLLFLWILRREPQEPTWEVFD